MSLLVRKLTLWFNQLPFIVDIIKHGKELDGKSTGVQAAILSDQVNLFTYPDIQHYDDPDKVRLRNLLSSIISFVLF